MKPRNLLSEACCLIYLAACTVYASLFQKSPVGLPYTAGLDVATARFLPEVAWGTVQEYFRE